MTIALSAFLTKINNLLYDNISGTTDAAGAADKTTFVDSALSKYEDNYFGSPERNPEWWAYISSQLRTIKSSQSSGGVITVHKAFSAQIASATAYQIHHFDRDKKIIACNQALTVCYPRFYKRLEDVTLTGKGSGDNKYEVPSSFTEFPDQIFTQYVSGTIITNEEVTDYLRVDSGGKMYFYADITTAYPILLVGKTPLTQFTNDASTTELSDSQADIVSLLAAAIFCRTMSATVNATDAGRFDSLAMRYETLYDGGKDELGKPASFPRRLDWSWINE